MKRLAILLFSIFCIAAICNAQTYTQHVQQKQAGKGSVTITQSKEINDLVNGVNQSNPKPGNATKSTNNPVTTTNKPTTTTRKPVTTTGDKAAATRQKEDERTRNEKAVEEKRRADKTAEEKKAEEKKRTAEAEEKKRADAERQQQDDEEMNIPTIDMRKKVMRNAHKVTGYRVQAFAGGNTRADKQKAQQIGNAIKMRFPDQPIYVHFYNPRWICRVGNYRSYNEAQRMLRSIRAMGYKSATIVKGRITVFE